MMDLHALKTAWAADWKAIKAGCYVAPLPAARKVVRLDRPNNVPPPNKATLAEVERDKAIAAAYADGEKVVAIAATHGVHHSYVNIVRRRFGLPARRARK